jgi:hypothetical protein
MKLAAVVLSALMGSLPVLSQAGPTAATPWLVIDAVSGNDVSTQRVDLVQTAGAAGVWTLDGGSLQIGDITSGGLLSGLQLTFDPDPFINASVTFTDFGASTQLTATFFSPLLLGGTAFDYVLDGALTATTPNGASLTVGDVNLGGQDGLFFGLVDGAVVDAIGAGQAGNSPLVIDPSAATGSGTCVTCTNFGVGIGLVGAGGDATHTMSANWTLTTPTGNGVPEPGTLALLAAGVLASAAARSARPSRAAR